MKKIGESYIDYKKRVIDSVSPTFCAAKWLNSTIWLFNGTTSSCHHPRARMIDPESVKKDPSFLHNTPNKLKAREEMLSGIQTEECSYCWKIENQKKKNLISDRVFKTEIYSDEEIAELLNQKPNHLVSPKTLEVAFSRTCNFACLYCYPAFSTKWSNDIVLNGEFDFLPRITANHYRKNTSKAFLAQQQGPNVYIEAFWRWFPDLIGNLNELRITGGEPLLDNNTWKLLKFFADNKPKTKLAINSNLGVPESKIELLLQMSQEVPKLEIYTSNEGIGKVSEYIRDGIDFRQWETNFTKLLESSNIKSVNIMQTINILSIFSMSEFLDYVVELKRKYGISRPAFSCNFLQSPKHLSVCNISLDTRLQIAMKLELSLKRYLLQNLITEFEASSLRTSIEYLRAPVYEEFEESKRVENKSHLLLYLNAIDQRRKKSFRKSLATDFCDWLDS